MMKEAWWHFLCEVFYLYFSSILIKSTTSFLFVVRSDTRFLYQLFNMSLAGKFRWSNDWGSCLIIFTCQFNHFLHSLFRSAICSQQLAKHSPSWRNWLVFYKQQLRMIRICHRMKIALLKRKYKYSSILKYLLLSNFVQVTFLM